MMDNVRFILLSTWPRGGGKVLEPAFDRVRDFLELDHWDSLGEEGNFAMIRKA